MTTRRAFKHVPHAFSKSFASCEGVKIGSFSYYRGLENFRGDPLDGSIKTQLSANFDGPVTNDDREVVQRAGFDVTPGSTNIVIEGMSVRRDVPNGFIFCASAEPDVTLFSDHDIFEIDDVWAFAHALARARPDILADPICGPVRYEERTFDALAGDPPPPNAFIKDPKFAGEKEIRIAWRGIRLTPADDLSFVIRAPGAARHVRRWFVGCR